MTDMGTEWVGKSLTIWGVIIALLTAVLPAVGLLFPKLAGTITPEWLAGIDATVKNVITSVGVLVGSIMISVDRFSGNTAKQLVWKPTGTE
jgi:hypothetical protein